MAIFKPKVKDTTEYKLQKVFNLGREEALKEVLKWLEEITIDDADGCGHPIVSFISFDYKEEVLQSFKELFNIE